MCDMKIKMSKFSFFSIKKLYFKLIFNSIGGNCGLLFLQINFDPTHFGGILSGGFMSGLFSGAFMS